MEVGAFQRVLPARGEFDRLALDASPDAILFLDGSGRVLEWNGRAEEMFGWSPEEAAGKSLADLALPEASHPDRFFGPERLESFLKNLQSPPFRRRLEVPVRGRGGAGTGFPAELTISAFAQGEQWIYCVFLRDISIPVWVAQRNQVQNAITAILAGSPAVEDALPALLSAVCDRTPWICGSFWCLDKKDDSLFCAHFTDPEGPEFEAFRRKTLSLRLKIGEGLPGAVCRTGKPAWLEDIAAEAGFARTSETAQAGLQTAIAFPVRLNERIYGIFEFFSRQRHSVDPEFLELMDSLSGQLSLYVGRKQAEEMLAQEREELQREREKYSSLISTIDSIVWEADPKTWLFTFVSPQAERLLGYPVSRWLTEPTFWQDHIHPEDWDFAVSYCAENIRNKTPTYHFDYRMTAQDGRTLWFRDYVTLVLEQGEVVNLRGLLVDITHIKESERRFRKLADHAPVLIWMVGPDSQCTFVNKPWLEYTGRTLEQEIGEGWLEGIHPDDLDRCRESYRAHFQEKKPVRIEYRLRRADGSYGWVLDQGVPQFDAQGNFEGFIGSCIDITPMREKEERLRLAQKMEAVGRLAGGIAHDFNNLLTAINGYGDLLLAGLPPGDVNRDYAAEVKRAGERAASLTQQLLTYSRRQEVRKRNLCLNDALLDMEPMLRRLIGEDVDLRANPAPDLWTISMDPGQVEQILLNLSLNARDAMPHGGRLTLETSNVVLPETFSPSHLAGRPGPHVLLAVSDTGEGMSGGTLAHLFEPFFTTKEQGRGTGLGLSTVYGIVKQAEGSLDVESRTGKGTVFRAYIPALPGIPADAGTKPPPAPAGGVPTRHTVLLVEDEDVVRVFLRKVLESEGYSVLEAANGEEALAAQEKHSEPISLLISDVIMPRLGGMDLAARMRRLRPEIRILLVSGYTADSAFAEVASEWGSDFLSKPFSAQALLDKARKLLQTSAPADARKSVKA